MDPALVTGVIGVLGALLGAFVNGRFQERAAGRAEAVARADKRHSREIEAVLTLAEAISDHRTKMWARGEAVHKEDGDQRKRELQIESHATRRAVTRPAITLRVLITDSGVRASAVAMVTATFAMRNAYGSPEELTAARETAMAAHDRFVDVAAQYLQRQDELAAPNSPNTSRRARPWRRPLTTAGQETMDEPTVSGRT